LYVRRYLLVATAISIVWISYLNYFATPRPQLLLLLQLLLCYAWGYAATEQLVNTFSNTPLSLVLTNYMNIVIIMIHDLLDLNDCLTWLKSMENLLVIQQKYLFLEDAQTVVVYSETLTLYSPCSKVVISIIFTTMDFEIFFKLLFSGGL